MVRSINWANRVMVHTYGALRFIWCMENCYRVSTLMFDFSEEENDNSLLNILIATLDYLNMLKMSTWSCFHNYLSNISLKE